jgi:predicted enzyme related to lactoylglutathione lyase
MASPVAYWHVPDLEAKLGEVTAAGASVKEPAHDVGGGRVVATVTDPMATSSGCFRTDERRPPAPRFVNKRVERVREAAGVSFGE